MVSKRNRIKDEERTILSLSLSVVQKKALKQYALDNGTTAAGIVQAWIDKYGEDDPDFVKKVNQDALDYCSTQADNCQLMHGVEELINDNK